MSIQQAETPATFNRDDGTDMTAASRNSMPPGSGIDPLPTEPRMTGDAQLAAFAHDCIEGMSRDHKALPCKWLYDDAGSQLFEGITRVEEYYPTRVEEALIKAAATQMADIPIEPVTLVELGSGASRKTRSLLAALDTISIYVPIDISADELDRAHASLREDFPSIKIMPLCADFTVPATLRVEHLPGPVLLFFPGSTLGNMAPTQAIDFLRALRQTMRADTRLLLGVDVLKDERTLCAAYDDAAGVTAAFNLNLLVRINRELGGTIDVAAFRHRALWNAAEGRIEMHLEAIQRQEIMLLGQCFVIEAGETIHTENSYKLSSRRWQEIFEAAGWRAEIDWRGGAPDFLLALLGQAGEGHQG